MSNLFWDGGPSAAADGTKILIATTVYENPSAAYTFSISRAREAMHKAGLPTAYLLLAGNCHVDDARNSVVRDFLCSDCTDLVFIDADVSFDPECLIELCQYTGVDIVGAVYPFRRPGSGDNMPVQMIPNVVDMNEQGLLRVNGLPTGFMRIRRNVLECLDERAEQFWNKADRRRKTPLIFERTFENGTRWGGDLSFCAKWRAMGGTVHAAPEIRLGHSGTHIERDSLGAALRRQVNETLKHLVERIRAGDKDPAMFAEALYALDNPYGALEDVLALCLLVSADGGDIVEAGSGLTTIVLAAANPESTVWCIEHDPVWAAKVEQMAYEAGTVNIAVCTAPIVDGWYDMDELEGMPEHFALGLNDGPPRQYGTRMGFFKHFGSRTDTIIVDDIDDPGYHDEVQAWCADNNREIDIIDQRGALIRKLAEKEDAA